MKHKSVPNSPNFVPANHLLLAGRICKDRSMINAAHKLRHQITQRSHHRRRRRRISLCQGATPRRPPGGGVRAASPIGRHMALRPPCRGGPTWDRPISTHNSHQPLRLPPHQPSQRIHGVSRLPFSLHWPKP